MCREAPLSAAAALCLRAWALPLLAGEPAGPPPAAPPAAWEIFLAVDRCALPLREALAAQDRLEGLAAADPVAAAALERRGMREAKHALALRLEAGGLAARLAARGAEALVLKGGALLLGGGGATVDVQDLDLLLRPEHALALAAELDAASYRREAGDATPGDSQRHELAARMGPAGIAVELHFDLAPVGEVPDPWRGALPLSPAPLRRMRPAAHLWHVLAHGVLHHPERRGALRDLLVAAGAVGACAPAELEEVRLLAAGHTRARPLLAMLEMAGALAARRPPRDAFLAQAATAYLLYDLTRGRGLPQARLLALGRTVHALAGEPGEYARLWRGSHLSVLSRGYAGDRWLDRRLPALGWSGRALWRGAHLLLALPAGLPLAARARSLARAAPG